jgi:hypothetical protein
MGRIPVRQGQGCAAVAVVSAICVDVFHRGPPEAQLLINTSNRISVHQLIPCVHSLSSFKIKIR